MRQARAFRASADDVEGQWARWTRAGPLVYAAVLENVARGRVARAKGKVAPKDGAPRSKVIVCSFVAAHLMNLTHFEMEQRLRQAGVALRPYPTLNRPLADMDLAAADQMLVKAGTAWEIEVERLFAIHQQAEELVKYASFGQLFDEVCTGDGLPAALAVLNEGVPHRYTAVYRLVGERMLNVALADKQNEPRPDFLAEVPITSSFCQYVLRDGSFLTGDSAHDRRLTGHPYQGVMRAYCGIPIFDLGGHALGTACHFDVVPHEIAEEKVAQLRAAARILSNYLSPHSSR